MTIRIDIPASRYTRNVLITISRAAFTITFSDAALASNPFIWSLSCARFGSDCYIHGTHGLITGGRYWRLLRSTSAM